jgi:sec-independent protein translocase protein TatC
MSLGDHLEELRARLILALLGLFLGMIVSLIFGTWILKFIEIPYNGAVRYRLQKTQTPQMEKEALGFVQVFFDTLTKQLADPNNAGTLKLDPNQIGLLQDVSTQAIHAWVQETHGGMGDKPLPFEYQLKSLAPAEAFMAYMKVSLISGLILTAPWVFYQIWAFVAAGLYAKERRYVYRAIPFSAALFIIGALFFLFVIARVTLAFFLSFGDVVSVASNWTVQRYISFISILMLVFGIAFQTPIAVFVLVRTGVVALGTLRSTRKYVILGLAFLSAVATPSPDPFSMIALLIPLYGLYELGILLASLAERKAKRKEQESARPTQTPQPSVQKQTPEVSRQTSTPESSSQTPPPESSPQPPAPETSSQTPTAEPPAQTPPASSSQDEVPPMS